MVGKYLAAVAAAALVASPVVAANPAASLSVSKSVRTGTSAKKDSAIGGAGFIVAALAVIAVGVGIYIVADEDDSPDSN